MKKTKWYPGDVKPARAGLYEREYGTSCTPYPLLDYWNGAAWRYSAKGRRAVVQNRAWRGLTAPAK